MSEGRLVVRVKRTHDALERVIALVRRRAFQVRRLSVAEAGHDTVLVSLRIDESRTPRDRVRLELEKLVDVLDVRDATAGPADGGARELLLARVGGAVVELTGSPEEVDAALERFTADGALEGFVRSGEVMLP